MLLRIAGINKESIVDGPGLRFVIFTQGCPHHCPQCHNPSTHVLEGGDIVEVAELIKAIQEVKLISGVTLSGGEPFLQPDACAALAREVQQLGLNVVTYSGYYYAELLAMAKNNAAINCLLGNIDILIDGPYEHEHRDLNLPFRGSSNQSIIHLR